MLPDRVVASQVARIQPRVVGRLQHAPLLVAVAEYPRAVRALHQVAHVKRFVEFCGTKVRALSAVKKTYCNKTCQTGKYDDINNYSSPWPSGGIVGGCKFVISKKVGRQ